MDYLLPCHPSITVVDRFDVVGADEPEVSLWAFLRALDLKQADSASALAAKLESIEATLRGRCRTDFRLLRDRLDHAWPPASDAWTTIWPRLVDLALDMPSLFPSNAIPVLTQDNPHAIFSRKQAACLVIHQFLLTVSRPDWMVTGLSDFHVWYSQEQAHLGAAEAYLEALITYLTRVGKDELAIADEAWNLHLFLHCLPDDTSPPSEYLASMSSLEIICPDEASTIGDFLGMPDGACVIFANKEIGFGRCGTQEETYVGSSPESCIAVLVTPPLLDRQALVIRGAEPMISTAGYGRTARLKEVLTPLSAGDLTYSRRTMLFMDALELDVAGAPEGVIPDMMPGNLERELTKATSAFSAYQGLDQAAYRSVVTGLWGCGAFGGNPYVKILIQLIASTRVGIPRLSVVLPGPENATLAAQLRDFAAAVDSEKISHVHILLALGQASSVDGRSWSADENPLQWLLSIITAAPS